jgi:hypothetical protein
MEAQAGTGSDSGVPAFVFCWQFWFSFTSGSPRTLWLFLATSAIQDFLLKAKNQNLRTQRTLSTAAEGEPYFMK